MPNSILILITIIFAWVFLLILLAPRIRESKRFSLIGPLLMIRAIKNRGVLDRIAKRFPAIGFSKFSVALVLATGVFTVFFLFYGAYLGTVSATAVRSEPLSYLIGIPGINPLIPVTYGIPAFVISVVIHEVFHGIVARKHGMKVSSVGTLLLVVPMGAFVEPDEEEMSNADPVVRRRVFAAGAGVNMVIGLVMVLLLAFVMMPGAQPMHDGVYVQEIAGNQPFASIIKPGQELISYGSNYSGSGMSKLLTDSNVPPGQMETMEIFNGQNITRVQYPAGVQIVSTQSGFPAQNAGMQPGTVLYSINGTMIYNVTQMGQVLDNITPGNVIPIAAINYTLDSGVLHGTLNTYNVTTVSKYSYYAKNDPSANSNAYKNQSYIGVYISYMGIGAIPMSSIKPVIFLSNVFQNPWYGFISSITLPITGFAPVPHHLTELYHTAINPTFFWGAMNMMFWLYWVNVLLGATNALPLLILDGNQFFRDTFFIAGKRKRLSFLRKEGVLNRIMSVLNVLVLFLLLWEIIVPRII